MADPLVPTVPISNTPYQAPLTPSTAAQTLNKYGIDPNQVLSADNIQQTITNPAPAPDDLLGIRSSLYNSTGVNAAQAEYQAARQAASSAALGLSERLTGLRGRAVSLNKITGTQAQERAVSSNEINALNAAEQLALGNYQAKKSEADAQFAIRESEVTQKRSLQAQYPGAKISVADSFDDAFKKIDKYAEEQKKEVYKATLKAKAVELGLKTKGNTKQLEKRISKANKSAIADAKKLSDLQLTKLQADIDNTRSEIANRGSSGISDSDVQAYVDAYGRGQITAPNIPTKIRDKVLAQAAPLLKQTAISQATSDIMELAQNDYSPELITAKIAALYPELNKDEIGTLVGQSTQSTGGYWSNLWKSITGK